MTERTIHDRCHCGEQTWVRSEADGGRYFCEDCGCPLGQEACPELRLVVLNSDAPPPPPKHLLESDWADAVRMLNAHWPRTPWPPQTVAAGYQVLRTCRREEILEAVLEISRAGQAFPPNPGELFEAVRARAQLHLTPAPEGDKPPLDPGEKVPNGRLEEWLLLNGCDAQYARRGAAVIRLGRVHDLDRRIRWQLAMRLLRGTKDWPDVTWTRVLALWLKVWLETKAAEQAFEAALALWEKERPKPDQPKKRKTRAELADAHV